MSLLSYSPAVNSFVPTSHPPYCKTEDKSLEPEFQDPSAGSQWASLVLLTVPHNPLPSSMKPAPIFLAKANPLLHSQCMFFIMAPLSFCLARYGFTYLSISPYILSPSPHVIGSQRARTGVIYLCNPLVQSPSHVGPFVTPWTVAHLAPLSMGFPRQEHWSGLLFPSPEAIPWVLWIVSWK